MQLSPLTISGSLPPIPSAFGRVRFGLMATGAEVLRHMGPDRRVEQVEDITNAAAAVEELGGDDEEILRFMDSADGYLLLMDSLSAALRQGWLDLASARHSMGASRVSSVLFDHKEQSAATMLQVDYSADLQPSESKPHFALSKWCLQEESSSGGVICVQDGTKPKLRYRGSEATPDGSRESDASAAKSSTGVDISNQVQSARSKELSVFGKLVSPKLRTTQVSFETALELIVELANSRSTMLSGFSQIKRRS
ncbi:coiled-coil domain-containing protein 115-like isoform X2 [Triticum urartu]|uniref:coiled-coil domain-containing protein 115-like isoform X2 n=1 Tax=Triticum urartu TaxID=4572 RepID=UPI0020441E56|nr:coiled-coil domain-containing protein 115-like isoform X2 [Triticum urartu]